MTALILSGLPLGQCIIVCFFGILPCVETLLLHVGYKNTERETSLMTVVLSTIADIRSFICPRPFDKLYDVQRSLI